MMRQVEHRGEKRRATIAAYIRNEHAAGRPTPTVSAVAALFAMSPERVAFHFRALGLAVSEDEVNAKLTTAIVTGPASKRAN
jgi:hypothetical protein